MLVLAAMSVLYRVTTTARLAAGVATVYGAIAVIDAVRLHWPAAAPLSYLNMAVWLIPGMFRLPTAAACSPAAPRWAPP